MEKKTPPTYKETYPKDLYKIIVEYGKKYSKISQLPLLQVLKEQTPIYFFIGNYSWDFDPNSEFSIEFEKRIGEGENIEEVVYDMQNKYYRRSTTDQEWFGCFRYKFKEEKKTGDQFIKIHFRNVDDTGLGPLAHENIEVRKSELADMFSDLKRNFPQAEYVQGSTWLYNYESYCRLFPPSYTKEMKNGPSNTQYMVVWGQFVNSEKDINKNLTEEFLNKVDEAETLEDLSKCFKYKKLLPRGRVEEFYDYYGIS